MTEKMKDGIIKRGNTYSYVIREKDPVTGVSKPKWFGGHATRAEAKRKRDEARAAVHAGTYVPAQDLIVKQYLTEWLDSDACADLKPSTADSYRQLVDRYLVPSVGDQRVQALSPRLLNSVFATLQTEGGRGAVNGHGGTAISARTVNYARSILRKALNDAIGDQIITVNPAVGTKPRKGRPAPRATWTGPQLQAFLGHVADDRLAPLWTLAAATGMRRGELMALRWSDVDLDAGIVSVDRSTTQVGKERVTTLPKNYERRSITVDAQTVAALRALKVVQASERIAASTAWVDAEGHLFTWGDGSPLQPDYITKAFGKAQAGVEVPRLVLHGLRHTHATILLREGVPVHMVSKRLGHRDVSVTLNFYADYIPEDDAHVVDIFRKAVWGA